MRTVALLVASCLVVPACGGPMLGNVPRPNTAAVAGGVAAAAAAITLADPDAASRKPEKKVDQDKRPVDVHENVPPDVFDRLDHQQPSSAADDDAAPADIHTVKGPAPRLPSPRDVLDPADRH